MKYTRYDLKKKNNNFLLFIIVIGIILILAFLSGTILSNIFIDKENVQKENSKVAKKEGEISNDKGSQAKISDISSFLVIQGGVFSNKDNAERLREELEKFGKAFLIEEQDQFRVILGIYSEKEALSVMENLQKDGKEYSRKTFKPELLDSCDVQICEIIDANLQIIHKLYDDKVKSIQSKQIKGWAINLEEVDKNSHNYKLLQQLKDNIKEMPKEISKDDIEKQSVLLYNVLNQMK